MPERQSKPISHVHLNMDTYYDISYDIPKRINSDIPDLVRKSTIHSFQIRDRQQEQDNSWLFAIPHHVGAFWTNLKYVCHGIEEPLEIGIVAVTENGSWKELLPVQLRPPSIWLDTKWPIPSLELDHGKLYIVVKPIPHRLDMQYLRIKILGFTDLFPISSYELLDEEKKPYLLFLNKNNNDDESIRTIWLPCVERDACLPKHGITFQKIRLIQDY
jgi:hypothetical protein